MEGKSRTVKGHKKILKEKSNKIFIVRCLMFEFEPIIKKIESDRIEKNWFGPVRLLFSDLAFLVLPCGRIKKPRANLVLAKIKPNWPVPTFTE